MLDGAKEAAAKRILANVTPSETPAVQALSTIIAELEHEQAEALDRLATAADIDLAVEHDAEARREQLVAVSDAVAEDRVEDVYLQQVGLDPEQAAPYLGIDGEDFAEQKRDWYRQYREQGIVDDDVPVDDVGQARVDEVAQLHVDQVFGVDLDRFESAVVEYDRGAGLQALLAGPIQRHTAGINAVADALEG